MRLSSFWNISKHGLHIQTPKKNELLFQQSEVRGGLCPLGRVLYSKMTGKVPRRHSGGHGNLPTLWVTMESQHARSPSSSSRLRLTWLQMLTFEQTSLLCSFDYLSFNLKHVWANRWRCFFFLWKRTWMNYSDFHSAPLFSKYKIKPEIHIFDSVFNYTVILFSLYLAIPYMFYKREQKSISSLVPGMF